MDGQFAKGRMKARYGRSEVLFENVSVVCLGKRVISAESSRDRVGHVGDSKLAMFSSDISRERVRRAGWKTAASKGAGESGIVCKPLYMIWWSVTFGSPPNASSITCTTSSVVRCGLRGLTRSVSRNRNGRRGVRSRICFKKPCSTRTLLAIDGSLKKTMNTRSVGVAVYTYFL